MNEDSLAQESSGVPSRLGAINITVQSNRNVHNNHFEGPVSGVIAHSENNGDATALSSAPQMAMRRDTPRSAIEVIPRSKADHDIYYDQLILRKRGCPLYLPGPISSSPIEYRRIGTQIGDIGIVYQSGSFDYLFNILYPANHPINRGRVPQRFRHFKLQREDSCGQMLGPDSFVTRTSACIRKRGSSEDDSSDSDFIFKTTENEGAVLALPSGSKFQDLLNKNCLKNYIAKNARQWYSYIKERRGREVNNGDVRLVIGFDKAHSWGIATVACSQGSGCLEFRRRRVNDSFAYTWRCPEGVGNGRLGPPKEEIRDLMQSTEEPPLENQTIFIRSINFTLGGEISNTDLDVLEVRTSRVEGPGNRVLFQEDSSRLQASSSSSSGGPQVGQQRDVNILSSQFDLPIIHPSTYLNQFLLDRCPNAKIAITDDWDWISVIREDDLVFPTPTDLCQRIIESCRVSEENGIVTITIPAAPEPIIKDIKGGEIIDDSSDTPIDSESISWSSLYNSNTRMNETNRNDCRQRTSRENMAQPPSLHIPIVQAHNFGMQQAAPTIAPFMTAGFSVSGHEPSPPVNLPDTPSHAVPPIIPSEPTGTPVSPPFSSAHGHKPSHPVDLPDTHFTPSHAVPLPDTALDEPQEETAVTRRTNLDSPWAVTYNNAIERALDITFVHAFKYSTPVTAVRFSPDGTFLAAALQSHLGRISIYDVNGPTKYVLAEYSGYSYHNQECSSGIISPGYSYQKQQCSERISSVCFSRDDKYLVAGVLRQIHIWEIARKRILAAFKGHTGTVWSLDLSFNGRLLVTASFDGSVRIWKMRDGSSKLLAEKDDIPYIMVRFSPNGRYVAASNEGKSLRIWDVRSGKLVGRWNGHQRHIWSVAFSPDGEEIMSGTRDGEVMSWDVSSLQGPVWSSLSTEEIGALRPRKKQEFCGHSDTVRSIAVSPDGKWVMTGSDDKRVCIWDIDTAVLQCTLEGHMDQVTEVDFSSNGNYIATGTYDGFVTLWRYEMVRSSM